MPLSDTTKLNTFVPGRGVAGGVHENSPLAAFNEAPGGKPGPKLKLRALAGRSPSVALTVKLTGTPDSTVRLAGTVRAGGWFTSITRTVKRFVALKGGEPLSRTTIVMVFVPGPWASVGCQVKMPLLGPIVAPTGGVSSEKVCWSLGRSGSFTTLVRARSKPSLIDWSATGASVGGSSTGITTTGNVLVTVSCPPLAAPALSRTTTETVAVPCALGTSASTTEPVVAGLV